jgi:hypothetical protein
MNDFSSSSEPLSKAESSLTRSILSTRNMPLGFISSGCLNPSSDDSTSEELANLAESILEYPIATRRLSERVLEMMRQDLYRQRERGNQFN